MFVQQTVLEDREEQCFPMEQRGLFIAKYNKDNMYPEQRLFRFVVVFYKTFIFPELRVPQLLHKPIVCGAYKMAASFCPIELGGKDNWHKHKAHISCSALSN